MAELQLGCDCGKVTAKAKAVTASSGLYVRCFCKDCQAFAEAIGKETEMLDQYGGSEIYQQALCNVEVLEGKEHVACLRLKPEGLYRWYTSCCNTPMGNTFGLKLPYFGIVKNFIKDPSFNQLAGELQGSYYKVSATTGVPKAHLGKHSEWVLIMKILGKFLQWKLTGKTTPNHFFDEKGEPVVKPRIVNE